jgi:5'-nucleotidase
MHRIPAMTSLTRTASVAALAALTLGALASDASAMRILLTNDDGYDSVALDILRQTLEADGHTVFVIAPTGERSGSGHAITLGAVPVVKIAPRIFSVDAFPASTTILGVTAILADNPPDLVVSGINFGANLGPASVASGTVGAALAATDSLKKPIPAIAVSADLIDADRSSPANLRHYREVSRFVVRLIAAVDPTAEAYPDRVVLNVNYPGLTRSEVAGVRWAHQGLRGNFLLGYAESTTPGIYAPTFELRTVEHDIADSDTVLLQQGYVTVVPLMTDLTADGARVDGFEPTVEALRP